MSNISADLEASVRDYVRRHEALELVLPTTLEELTETVAEAFVQDRDSLWWWDALAVRSASDSYGENDGLARVQDMLNGLAGRLFVVVTDDERPPWLGVRGKLQPLLMMLREHHFFEYFIVDESVSWILFDTHHNTLVLAGDLNKTK